MYTRQDAIKTVVDRNHTSQAQEDWQTSDFKLTVISTDHYLLTYNLIQNQTRQTRRASIWRKEQGQWKILYHQGTIKT